MITIAKKIESTTQPVLVLGLHSSANEDIRFDAWWLALLDEVRQLEANAPNRLVTDCDDFIEKSFSFTEAHSTFALREKRTKPNARPLCAVILGDRDVHRNLQSRF